MNCEFDDMNSKLLVFGGTTEGRQVIDLLNSMELDYIYSTKTPVDSEAKRVRSGALNEENLIQLIKEENIRAIIHASHPFATELHRTIAAANDEVGIPVYRLERKYSRHLRHPQINYVDSYFEAMDVLRSKNTKKLLALTGVQTISKLAKYWQKVATHFRILDRDSSKKIAEKNGVPEDQLILGYPNKTVKEEEELIKQNGFDAIITKESGHSGGLELKIQAALNCDIPIVIIKRPELPTSFQKVYAVEEFRQLLKLMAV